MEGTRDVDFNALILCHYFRCLVAIRKGVLLIAHCSLWIELVDERKASNSVRSIKIRIYKERINFRALCTLSS